MSEGVNVSIQTMYELLIEVRDQVVATNHSVNNLSGSIVDHEARLRALEAEEDNGHRVERIEQDLVAIRTDLEAVQRRLWAIPSAATVIAAAALLITLIRWL